MTHDVTVSAAECAECKRLTRAGLDWAAEAHLQDQKDAWWLMGQALGDNPIAEVIAMKPKTALFRKFQDALRHWRVVVAAYEVQP